jgi:hypothetical protein
MLSHPLTSVNLTGIVWIDCGQTPSLLNLHKKILAQMHALPSFAKLMNADMPSKYEGNVEGQRGYVCQVAAGHNILFCLDGL